MVIKNADGRFLYIAGDPCLDFLNTRLKQKGELVDRLGGIRDLADWLRGSSLEMPGIPESLLRKWEASSEGKAILDRARRFREMLRDMVCKIIRNRRAPDAVLREINSVLSHGEWHAVVVHRARQYACDFRLSVRSPEHLLIPVAEAAARLLCDADFSLIRKCGNEACVLLFYDRTKNHRRNWCSMSACGNRSKAAAYYRRKKTEAGRASRRRR